MDTKLTLKLDEDIIKKAKDYAKTKNRSLSHLVEDFFRIITTEKEETEEHYSPIVLELSGSIQLGSEEDLKDEYADYLIEKYK